MKTKNLILALIVVMIGQAATAHEGHNHDAPTSIPAPKGGIVKSLEKTNVEVVSKSKDIKIYLYDKDMKPQDATEYKVVARAELPRAKKSESINLVSRGTYFEGSYDAKGSHRYTLVVSVTDPKIGHADSLTFTIEPRK